MKHLRKNFSVLILLILGLSLLTSCNNNASNTTDKNQELVVINVERTGGLLNGIGKVTVYIDDEQVMKVKNNQTNSAELYLSPGVHTIQTKGQGDKSSLVNFEVVAGEDNTFTYHTEISNIYGVSLERTQ
ncbi:hypothetical protein [Paenibacillus polymyxa]|uniref:hypothetical protein n=2 Tax=Paenibacillus TaxID=44249 RepID=UPI0007E93FDF|nr:hypothetical protein [Paenibacillus polymyxa]MDN4081408.1 hypothetical protein [Paenibacillus polymyxa]MDN4109737.1 hypothetical protein [Paenibacillus polymyxa]OAZ42747.1 hypothetical protein A9Z39_22610 [Paenibacillus polymyxa]